MSSHAVFGGGLWFLFFWLSTLLAIFYVAVPVLAVGLSVWLATFRARRDVPRWLIRRARVGRRDGGMALCREHGPDARVRGRRLGAKFDPGLEVFQPVDDAAAELRIAWPRAVDPVLLQRTDGQADEACGLGRAKVARREASEIGGHAKPP